MKIIWSDFAIEMLKEIYIYHKENVNKKIANKIKNNIFASTNLLINNPKLGKIEVYLEQLNEGHRHLIQGNYKIIYKEIKEGILITDIFDTRQNPVKLKRNKQQNR